MYNDVGLARLLSAMAKCGFSVLKRHLFQCLKHSYKLNISHFDFVLFIAINHIICMGHAANNKLN